HCEILGKGQSSPLAFPNNKSQAQAQFKKQKPPATYCYDSSLAPELQWDGQNAAREVGESQLSVVSGQWSVVKSQLKELRTLLATDNGQLTTDQRHQIERAIAQ